MLRWVAGAVALVAVARVSSAALYVSTGGLGKLDSGLLTGSIAGPATDTYTVSNSANDFVTATAAGNTYAAAFTYAMASSPRDPTATFAGSTFAFGQTGSGSHFTIVP